MENNFKHTPGKWSIVDSRECIGIDIELSDHNFQITDSRALWIANVNKGLPNDEANARLIAAAPELLEALLAVRRHGLIEQDGYEAIVRQVGEAIQKATA